ncbi:MAG: DNA polymerase III subunit beta [Patescibacteria group bacterium]
MKIECITERLKEVIPKVERITGKNLTLPSLSSILIIASGKTLKLRATNLDLGIEIEIPARIEKEGAVLVNGVILNSIISSLTSKNIKIELVQGNIEITAPPYKSIIKTYPQDDFPTIPIVSGQEFSFDSKKIIQAIKAVSYSASFSDMKPEIASVYIYENNGDMVFVATDSFRLAEKKIKLKKPQNFNETIIPIKNIIEIIKIFDQTDGDISVFLSKNQIAFSHQNIYLTSRTISGVFPDYKQIIPKEHKTKVVLLKQDIISSLRSVSVFSGKFNELTVSIKPRQKTIEFYTKHQDLGESKIAINGAINGEEFEASFNYKYISDCLQSISEDSVSLFLNGQNKPLLIRSASDMSFLYLIMPMNK